MVKRNKKKLHPAILSQVSEVIKIVSKDTGVDISRIRMYDRHIKIATARFIIYYVLFYHNKLSLIDIGRAMGRTHAAVINGITIAESWDRNNKIRDKQAIKNGDLLEKIMTKLKQ